MLRAILKALRMLENGRSMLDNAARGHWRVAYVPHVWRGNEYPGGVSMRMYYPVAKEYAEIFTSGGERAFVFYSPGGKITTEASKLLAEHNVPLPRKLV